MNYPVQAAANIGYALVIGTLLLVLPIFLTLDLNALNPGDFLHGRYTYLPSAGLMLPRGDVLAPHRETSAFLYCLACGLVAVVFAVLAVSQERQVEDDLTVFTVADELAPHNAPVAKNVADAHVQVALQLADDGRCKEAMPVFEQVSQEYPQDWYAWAGLGELLCPNQQSCQGRGVAEKGCRTLLRSASHAAVARTSCAHGFAECRSIPIESQP